MTKAISNPKIRNKERTKQKLINSIGKIIKKKGFHAISVKAICEASGVDKKMIYFHFGGIPNLVNTFLKQNDYWQNLYSSNNTENNEVPEKFGEKEVINLLQNQFLHFSKNKESQGMMLWELCESNKFLRQIADQREIFGNKLLEITEKDFNKTDIDIRAVTALLVAGIYYLILHSSVNGSTTCGIDINSDDGKIRISKAIEKIISLNYKDAAMQNKRSLKSK